MKATTKTSARRAGHLARLGYTERQARQLERLGVNLARARAPLTRQALFGSLWPGGDARPLTRDERRLLQAYRGLSAANRAMLRGVVADLLVGDARRAGARRAGAR